MLPSYGPYTITFSGYEGDLTQSDVDQFLVQRSPAGYTAAGGPGWSPQGYTVTVGSKAEAEGLVGLSGIRFRGSKLLATCLEGRTEGGVGAQVGGSQLPDHIKTMLKQGIVSMYQAESNVLVADNLAGKMQAAAAVNPEYGKVHVDWGNFTFVNTVLHIMHENFPQVASVCLDNNGIASLSAFRSLPTLCPAVQNLSIAYNQVADVSDLKGISGMGLRELRLSGNPVAATAADKLKYHQDVKAVFPTLQNLDGECRCRPFEPPNHRALLLSFPQALCMCNDSTMHIRALCTLA